MLFRQFRGMFGFCYSILGCLFSSFFSEGDGCLHSWLGSLFLLFEGAGYCFLVLS